MTDADLIILPGGVKSLEKLRLEKKVIKFIKEWNEKNKLISSTCHGAQLLISSTFIVTSFVSSQLLHFIPICDFSPTDFERI